MTENMTENMAEDNVNANETHVQTASAQTLEAGVIALTQLMGEVKKRVESLDNLIVPERKRKTRQGHWKLGTSLYKMTIKKKENVEFNIGAQYAQDAK